jgi:hypothetical protein
MEDYLKLLSEILHKPWEIKDEWINWTTPQLETQSLPTSLVVAKPLESEEYEAVRKRALENFAAGEWHAEQVRVLFFEYERAQKMNAKSLEDRFDKDGRLRERLFEDLKGSDLLVKVGDQFVQNLARKLQSEELPQATQFHVASLKPDLLDSIDLSRNMFEDGDIKKNWTSFVSEILGKATAWSPLAYSTTGLFERLEKRNEVNSYAFIPDRIKSSLDSSVTPVVMEESSGSGVEVVVRVDISQWIDPENVSILDESKAVPSDSTSTFAPSENNATQSSSSDGVSGHVTF